MSFEFGTPYVEIRDILASENEALFRRNSVLGLLERDAVTKRAPERWQALVGEEVASFDVVVCFESRVFDLVVEGTFVSVLSFCSENVGGLREDTLDCSGRYLPVGREALLVVGIVVESVLRLVVSNGVSFVVGLWRVGNSGARSKQIVDRVLRTYQCDEPSTPGFFLSTAIMLDCFPAEQSLTSRPSIPSA